MKIKDSTFFGLLFAAVFLIIVLHISLKNLLHEPIFRNTVNSIRKIISPAKEEEQTQKYIPLADSKQELLDYIKSSIKEINQNDDIRVKASNFYSPFHQSDIHNEETDLSKYFQINQGVPEVTQLTNQLHCNKPDLCKQPIKPSTDPLSGNPLHFDQGSNGSLTFKPDIWTYENERPMNGGHFDGVRGQDTMQNDFAIYPSSGEFNQNTFQKSYPYIQSSGAW
jgi:hypothetical protein